MAANKTLTYYDVCHSFTNNVLIFCYEVNIAALKSLVTLNYEI